MTITNKPKVYCLCGSTKFKRLFSEINKKLSLAGHIVLSVGCFTHAERIDLTEKTKADLDQLHLRKLDMADVAYIINPAGYVGKSLINEIRYCRDNHIPIKWLEPPCEYCDGAGSMDSGGVTPQGDGIEIACEACRPGEIFKLYSFSDRYSLELASFTTEELRELVTYHGDLDPPAKLLDTWEYWPFTAGMTKGRSYPSHLDLLYCRDLLKRRKEAEAFNAEAESSLTKEDHGTKTE